MKQCVGVRGVVGRLSFHVEWSGKLQGDGHVYTDLQEGEGVVMGTSGREHPSQNSTGKGPEVGSRESKEARQCGSEKRRGQSGWKK